MTGIRFFRQFRRRALNWRPLPLVLIALVLVVALATWKGATDWQPGGPPGAPVVTSNDPLLAVHVMTPFFAAPEAIITQANGGPPAANGGPPTSNGGPPTSNGGPRLELSSSFYDFGVLRSATALVSRDFYIINRGAAPLVIRQAITTCGCTTARLSAAVAPPGASIRATVTFDPAFHDLAGQTVRRGLILLTNDPDHPEAAIWVQASLR